MPVKRRGKGIGSTFKKIGKAAKSVNKFAKKTKIASKGLKLAADISGNQRLKKASKVAKSIGYGRK